MDKYEAAAVRLAELSRKEREAEHIRYGESVILTSAERLEMDTLRTALAARAEMRA